MDQLDEANLAADDFLDDDDDDVGMNRNPESIPASRLNT